MREPREGDRVMIERYGVSETKWHHGVVTRTESGQGLRIFVRVDGESRDRMFGGAIGPRVVVVEPRPTPRTDG